MASPSTPDACGVSINRNIVECKSVKRNVLSPVSSVLIETLWNVNEYLRRITEGSEQY